MATALVLSQNSIGLGQRPSPSNPPKAPVADNLLVIVADIQRHANEDPYRFAPPTDLLGQNVFRAGLIRLANWEKLHPGKARDVVAFNRALCWERLGALTEAIREYEACAGSTPEAAMKKASQDAIGSLKRVVEVAATPLDQSVPRIYEQQLREQAKSLDQLARSFGLATVRGASVRVLKERVDIRLAEYLAAVRFISPYTTQDAVTALKANVENHKNSRLVQWHKLRLAEFYIELAKEYCIRFDPDGADFSAKDFEAYTDPARKLLLEIERADGYPEKPEARHRLASLEAFIISITDRAR